MLTGIMLLVDNSRDVYSIFVFFMILVLICLNYYFFTGISLTNDSIIIHKIIPFKDFEIYYSEITKIVQFPETDINVKHFIAHTPGRKIKKINSISGFIDDPFEMLYELHLKNKGISIEGKLATRLKQWIINNKGERNIEMD